MIESIGRRLRVAFLRTDDESPPGDPADDQDAQLLPLVEFVAYAEDCVLSGRVRLAAERLTDMLNDHDEVQLVDVLVEPLDGSAPAEIREVFVKREELVVVHATGPRGDAALRHRTRQHPVSIDLGRYSVHGYLHALPGADPLDGIRRRKTMVPLTDATLEYEFDGEQRIQRAGVLAVNRDHIDAISHAVEHDVEMPNLPAPTTTGRLTKDFTGDIVR